MIVVETLELSNAVLPSHWYLMVFCNLLPDAWRLGPSLGEVRYLPFDITRLSLVAVSGCLWVSARILSLAFDK